MKTKFLTGYKMIKPVKKYKMGIKRAYRSYLKYVYKKSGELKKGIIASKVAPDIESFKEAILSAVDKKGLGKTAVSKLRISKSVLREVKMQTKYVTSLKTAKVAYEKYLDMVDEPKYSLKEFRKMATNVDKKQREEGVMSIVGVLEDQIKADYKRMRAEGLTSYEARDYISETYFGGKS